MSKDVQPEICRTKQENTLKSDANKIFKMYHISAPFEEPNTGDYDYCNKFNELINDYAPKFKKKYGQKLQSQYLKLSDLGVDSQDVVPVLDILSKIEVSYKEPQQGYRLFEQLRLDSIRQAIVAKIKNYIEGENISNGSVPIINLQLRPFPTGFIFVAKDIEDFKMSGIKINVTCHEYKLNEERPFFQAILHSYFKAADCITFFNESDFTRAKKHANRSAFDLGSPYFKKTKERIEERVKEWKDLGENRFKQWIDCFDHEPYFLQEKKVIFTRVPPTIGYTEDITFEEFQQIKKPNIIVFGMIRGNKGFEAALDIAKVLKDKVTKGEITSELKNAQVIIVGNPVANRPGADLLAKILLAKYGIVSCKNVLQVEKSAIPVKTKILDILQSKDADVQMQEVVTQLEQEMNYDSSLPIDIRLNPTPEEIRELYANNKYAVKYDNKGWANNASSHIASLVNNCIVYTAWGINVSDDVGEKNGKYNDAIQLLQDRKYGLRDGAALSLKQINNGAKKKNFLMSGEKNKYKNRDLIDANKLLNDIDSKETEDNLASMRKAFQKSLALKKQFVELVESDFIDELLQKIDVQIAGDNGE